MSKPRTVVNRAELGRQILILLAQGPTPMCALSASLVRSDATILRVLNGVLKGQVKRIGRHRATKWALLDYQAPERTHDGKEHIRIAPKPQPQTESWWVTAARESFFAAAVLHQPRMMASRESNWVKGIGTA